MIGSDAANYTLAGNTLTADITKANITIAANADKKFFDGKAYSGGNGIVYQGLLNGDTSAEFTGTLNYSGTSQGAVNVGEYSILPQGLSSNNYTIQYASANLTISEQVKSVDQCVLNPSLCSTTSTQTSINNTTNTQTVDAANTDTSSAKGVLTYENLPVANSTNDAAQVPSKDSSIQQSEAQASKLESEAQLARVEANEAKTPEQRKEALLKAEEKSIEALVKRAEVQVKKDRSENADFTNAALKAFQKIMISSMDTNTLAMQRALRREYKSETFASALNMLQIKPNAADLPLCAAGVTGTAIQDLCIPQKKAQAPVSQNVQVEQPKKSFLPQIERKVALLVGINNYSDPKIPALESAVPDAEAVGKLLADKLGYTVRILKDPTKANIVSSMNQLSSELTANDSVLLYYAGHGYALEKDKVKTGYWLLADASIKDPSKWVSNNDISKLMSNIPAKQTMLVSDSCYSGNLVGNEKVVLPAGTKPENILSQRAVTVMSSGGDEPVSDEGKDGHSIFAWSLMESIKAVDSVQPVSVTFDAIRSQVTQEYPQLPQYGSSPAAGHKPGSDYLLEVRSLK